jgi:hypothetical protein
MPTLNELAALLGAEVVGDGSVVIHRMAPIDSAGPGDITFVANPRYLLLSSSRGLNAPVLPCWCATTPTWLSPRFSRRCMGNAPRRRG